MPTAKLMLIHPIVDCSMRTEIMAKFSDTPVWNSKLNKKMWKYYLQGVAEKSLLDLAPNELQKMPATYIETAEFKRLSPEYTKLMERTEQINKEHRVLLEQRWALEE